MSVLRRVEILGAFVFSFFSVALAAQNCSTMLFEVRENMISDSLISIPFSECTAILVLSKNQCSNCNKNLPDIFEVFRENRIAIKIIRVVDQPLMECKKEELVLKELIEDLELYYIGDSSLKVFCDKKVEEYSFGATPSLLLFLDGILEQIPAKLLIDDYGRPDLELIETYRCSR